MKETRQPIRTFARGRLTNCLTVVSKTSAKAINTEKGAHEFRVALRRLENCVQLFGPMFSKPGTKRVIKQLDDVRKRMGEIRDCDVYLRTAPALIGSINSDVLRRLAARRDEQVQKLDWKPKTAAKWQGLLEI